MTTIYVDSRKSVGQRLRGCLGEPLHLQSDARLAVYKIRLHLHRDHEQPERRLQMRTTAAPPASPTKPFSVDHMLGPSFVSGGQQVFEFVWRTARSTCAGPSRVLGNLGDDILSKITLKSGVGIPEAHALPADRPGRERPALRVALVVRPVSRPRILKRMEPTEPQQEAQQEAQ